MGHVLRGGGGKGLTWWVLGVFTFMMVFGAGAPGNAYALTLSEEKSIGRKILTQIRGHFNLIEDGEVLAYVQAVGDRIVPQLGTTPYNFQFFVIDDGTPNAFAIPGGYIFMHRGLLEILENEGQLAAILSHELAHIHCRHIYQRIEKGKFVTIASIAAMLAAAFLGTQSGGAGGQALAVGAIAGSQTMALQYSRENEAEADRMGFRFLCDSGYDPVDMAEAMQRLKRTQWKDENKMATYLATHPAVGERVQYLRAMADNKLRQDGKRAARNLKQPVGDFTLMQAALLSEYSEKQAAADRFQTWKGDKESSAAADYGLGRLSLRQGQMEQAVSHLRDAVRQKPDSPMVLSALGYALFQKGDTVEAQKTFENALLLDPGSAISHYRLGLLMEEQGRKDQALKHLKQAEPLSDVLPEVDYHLGVVLGKVNDMGPAHFHLGRYYLHVRDWQTAEFHLKKAKVLLAGNPEKREEIEEALEDARTKGKGDKKTGSSSTHEKRGFYLEGMKPGIERVR